jgi:Helicase associated domain
MEQEATSLLALKRDALGDAVSQQEPRLQGLYLERDGLQAALQMQRRQLARLLSEPAFSLPVMTRPSSPSLLAQSLGHLPVPLYGETTAIRTQMLQEILLRNEVNRYLEDRMVRARQLELMKSHSSPTAIAFEPVGRATASSTFDRPGLIPAVSPLATSPVPTHRDVENEAPAAKRLKVDRKYKPSASVASDASSKEPINSSGHMKKNKDLKWRASLEKLKTYKNQFGDCIVPRGYAQDPQLASWVAEQRCVALFCFCAASSRRHNGALARLTFSVTLPQEAVQAAAGC